MHQFWRRKKQQGGLFVHELATGVWEFSFLWEHALVPVLQL
jgi:hypothetical protein